MITTIKVINSILILAAVFMGLKQGWAMFTRKPEMVEMFSKWNFSETGLMIIRAITLISALFILYPKTFVWGNFLMAAGILLIICFHLSGKDLRGVMVEVPFLLLNLIIIYLQHPFSKPN